MTGDSSMPSAESVIYGSDITSSNTGRDKTEIQVTISTEEGLTSKITAQQQRNLIATGETDPSEYTQSGTIIIPDYGSVSQQSFTTDLSDLPLYEGGY